LLDKRNEISFSWNSLTHSIISQLQTADNQFGQKVGFWQQPNQVILVHNFAILAFIGFAYYQGKARILLCLDSL
jgi:hypothetical protein